MKLIKATTVLIFVLGAVQFLSADVARAQSALLTATQMQTLLVGRYACGSSGADKWDEILTGGTSGTVTDFKKGPGDPVDPTAVVGSYQINASPANTITYNYAGGGGSYTYTVREAGTPAPGTGTYQFVGPSTLAITVQNSPCP